MNDSKTTIITILNNTLQKSNDKEQYDNNRKMIVNDTLKIITSIRNMKGSNGS